ncbi:hypothetical protein Ddye_025901 [Dipteronia dyeriana]|uniref:Reverse transcriptase n=1 Tax=Dipteronia dyeriana TaxID=168575 RepID=A0AAD9TLQ3_9ROSI|nr:hypothetical protein Ddye_025901 [Dipteronia dyeriana]
MLGLAEDPMSFEASLFSSPESSSTTAPTSGEGTVSSNYLLKTPQASVQSFLLTSTPLKSGGFVSIQIDPVAYQSRLELCKNSLIGRVALSSGERHWKLVDLKTKLARGIRVPLRLDKGTIDGDFGHDARVLVDVDMSVMYWYTFIYTRTYASVCRELWRSLREMVGSFSFFWFLVGDFNTVLGAHKCLGSRSPDKGSCKDFKSMIEDCNLIALPYRFSDHNSLWIWLAESQTVIKDHIVRFYLYLFSSDSAQNDEDLSTVDDIVPSLVSQEANSCLVVIPSTDVIHDMVFAMNALSAPRPDGFSSRFFQRCWENVGKDVILTVQDFFQSGVVGPGLNSNFIVLLPKMRDSITVDQFRSIMLGNFLRFLPISWLTDKILFKFSKWKGKSLFLAGQATLIRSVNTSSIVHSFMVYKWLFSLTKMVTKKIRNFLWTVSCKESKLVRVAWNRCCRPYALKGLGLKDLALLNDS